MIVRMGEGIKLCKYSLSRLGNNDVFLKVFRIALESKTDLVKNLQALKKTRRDISQKHKDLAFVLDSQISTAEEYRDQFAAILKRSMLPAIKSDQSSPENSP